MVLALGFALAAQCATLQVGPGRPFSKPCAAIAAAAAGDTIEIDAAGEYAGDVCAWNTDRLTLRGVGGRARIDAAGRSSQGKAIWVIGGADTVVENIEFSGAAVADKNGAGIRHQGGNLTVRNCYFHDNENGILGGDAAASHILVEYSEFANNGAGDGYSHNLYIGRAGRFTLRFSYSHHSKVGHLVKSRATENYILYNRLSDEAAGTGSYEINLPNGGRSFVIGNIIEQGPRSQNSTILSYREEGPHALNPDTSLTAVNNTFVNNRPQGATFIAVAAAVETPAVIRNNVFAGSGTLTNQSQAVLENNLVTRTDPGFVDAANYDFKLRASSAAIDAGADPGTPPLFQYVHPACGEGRQPAGAIDIGAFEFGGEALDPQSPAQCRRIAFDGVVIVAPGAILTLPGANLAADTMAAAELPLPLRLGGVAVHVNDVPAPLFAVAPARVTVQVPYEIPPGPARVTVELDSTTAAPADITIAPAAPVILGVANEGGGRMTVYFTGQGQVDPSGRPLLPVRATLGGQEAAVDYAVLAPGLVGLTQAGVRTPALAAGEWPLVIIVGDAASAPFAVSVQP
jgi:uncharacterized protein (TIGR03437 family)